MIYLLLLLFVLISSPIKAQDEIEDGVLCSKIPDKTQSSNQNTHELLFVVDQLQEEEADGIYRVNADTLAEPQRIYAEDNVEDLAWSPDGSRFAFSSWDNKGAGLYVMEFEKDAEPLLVTYFEAKERVFYPLFRNISWLDEQSLLFSNQPTNTVPDGVENREGIYTVRIETGKLDQLLDISAPFWYFDSNKKMIFYLMYSDNGSQSPDAHIYQMNNDGSNKRVLDDSPGQKTILRYSPNQIIVLRYDPDRFSIYTIDVNALEQTDTFETVYSLNYSPTGEYFAFYNYNNEKIYRSDLTQDSICELTDFSPPMEEIRGRDNINPAEVFARTELSWSTDGQSLAAFYNILTYIRSEGFFDLTEVALYSELRIIGADGSTRQLVLDWPIKLLTWQPTS